MNEYLKYNHELNNVFNNLDFKNIDKIFRVLNKKIKSGNQIFTCGNGGSGYNASHIVTDWNKMSFLNSNTKVRTTSLFDNIGLITAWANDVSFEDIFVGQLKSLFCKGDLLICLSGSGNSKNVINASNYANEIGETICITGFDGGMLKKICKHSIHIPSFDMQICEDIQMMICHIFMKKLSNIE